MEEKLTVEQRVQKGMDLLDSEPFRFGWWEDINLTTFDIDSHEHCILGQLGNGEYNSMCESLDIDDIEQQQDHGFHTMDSMRPSGDSLDLQKEWVKQINLRRA